MTKRIPGSCLDKDCSCDRKKKEKRSYVLVSGREEGKGGEQLG